MVEIYATAIMTETNMTIEHYLNVKVRHEGKGTKKAEEALIRCFDNAQFWKALHPTFEQGLRAAVEEVTGELFDFNLIVTERMPYFRKLRSEAQGAAAARRTLDQNDGVLPR